MSLTAALIIICCLVVALLITLAYAMSRARLLRPHRQEFRGFAWWRARARRRDPGASH
jgi:hypothetical protein